MIEQIQLIGTVGGLIVAALAGEAHEIRIFSKTDTGEICSHV
jgi:hypothetical protein